jgi:hypothetical protein
MNIILNSFKLGFDDYKSNSFASEAAVLLAATCIGNDGKSCPLFRGSLAPMIFATATNAALQTLLIESDTIEWTNGMMLHGWSSNRDAYVHICRRLQASRYSCRSLKSLKIVFVGSGPDNLIALKDIFSSGYWTAIENFTSEGSNGEVNFAETFASLTSTIRKVHVEDEVNPEFFTEFLPQLVNLESLALRQVCSENEHAFDSFNKLTKLKSLDFEETDLEEDSIFTLFQNVKTSLRSLRIRGEGYFRNFKGIGELENLESLTIIEPIVITEEEISSWRSFPFLTHLSLTISETREEIADNVFENFSAPNLQHLELTNTHLVWARDLMKNCRYSIQRLELWSWYLEDEDFELIASQMPNLSYLKIQHKYARSEYVLMLRMRLPRLQIEFDGSDSSASCSDEGESNEEEKSSSHDSSDEARNRKPTRRSRSASEEEEESTAAPKKKPAKAVKKVAIKKAAPKKQSKKATPKKQTAKKKPAPKTQKQQKKNKKPAAKQSGQRKKVPINNKKKSK